MSKIESPYTKLQHLIDSEVEYYIDCILELSHNGIFYDLDYTKDEISKLKFYLELSNSLEMWKSR